MQNVYRILAYAIAALVAVQAAFIAYAMTGLAAWVQGGGTLDKAAMESESLNFPGISGFMLHGMTGMMVIPALALLFVIFSFFAKVPGGTKWALIVLGLVVVQAALGIFSNSLTQLSILHGINATILFGAAVMAGLRVRRAVRTADGRPAESVPVHV